MYDIYYNMIVYDTLKNSITNIIAAFSYIKDFVLQKINDWTSKCSFKAGREVIIKLVYARYIAYVMSIFLLPTSIISTIEKIMTSFWWGNSVLIIVASIGCLGRSRRCIKIMEVWVSKTRLLLT